MKSRLLGHVRRSLLRGLALILPLVITVWLLVLLFDVVNRYITPYVYRLLERAGVGGLEHLLARLGVPLLSLLLTAVLIYLLGLATSNLIGRRLFAFVESSIVRLPLIGGIYGSARQLLEAFRVTGERTFSKVVLLEYPRRGLWTIGFLTSDNGHDLPSAGGSVSALPVFLPTTPNPTSGWMILVPEEDLVVLDMTIEKAVKLIVSGGIVSPANLGELVRE